MVFARPTRHPGRMPQLQLPIFPVGAVPLSPELAVVRDQDKVTYVHGSLPVFRHRAGDVKSFRFITSLSPARTSFTSTATKRCSHY